MPRAKDSDSSAKTSAAAIRIRENQRRSRARRKEYVEGMQRKLQEYETKGVAATLEMQQAARDVAIENSRLRLLLAHSGVGGEAVEAFLQSFKGQDGGGCGGGGGGGSSNGSNGSGGVETEAEAEADADADADTDAEAQAARMAAAESVAALGRASSAAMVTLFPEHAGAHIDKLAVLASASVQQSCCGGGGGGGAGPGAAEPRAEPFQGATTTTMMMMTMMTPDDSTTTAPSTGPVTPNSTSLNSPSPPRDQDFDSPMEMSCDAAAHIIAQMQGDCEVTKGGGLAFNNAPDDYLVQNSAFLKILEAASIFN